MNITLRRNKSDPDMIEIITDASLGGTDVWAVVHRDFIRDFLEDEISALMYEQDEIQVTLRLHESETE